MMRPMPVGDPRVYFAAERTLLAWIRTGISVIGFGFVVARFTLFMRMVSPEIHPHGGSSLPWTVGVGMVIMGSLCCGVAGRQFQRFVPELPAQDLPPRWSHHWPPVFAYAWVAIGLA
jgi:putative membrane protein